MQTKQIPNTMMKKAIFIRTMFSLRYLHINTLPIFLPGYTFVDSKHKITFTTTSHQSHATTMVAF